MYTKCIYIFIQCTLMVFKPSDNEVTESNDFQMNSLLINPYGTCQGASSVWMGSQDYIFIRLWSIVLA